MNTLTHSRLLDVYHYSPKTGRFKPKRSGQRGRPRSSGYVSKGYRVICIDYINYQANRLAWFYVTGEWPKGIVDHKNGNTLDDRFENLRDVSPSVNAQNRQGANRGKTDGLPLGVYRCGDKFLYRLMVNGVKFQKRGFETAGDAHAAYLETRRLFAEGNCL